MIWARRDALPQACDADAHARPLSRLNGFRLIRRGLVPIGCRSLRSLVLRCRFWRLARRASRALLVRAPGSPPGRKRGSGASRYARPFAPCGRLRRPRSRAAPALRRRALPAVPLPRAFAVGATPCARGSRPLPSGALVRAGCAARYARWGTARAGPPVRRGDLFFPLRTPQNFSAHQSVNWAKYAPKKRRKTPDFRGSFLLLII